MDAQALLKIKQNTLCKKVWQTDTFGPTLKGETVSIDNSKNGYNSLKSAMKRVKILKNGDYHYFPSKNFKEKVVYRRRACEAAFIIRNPKFLDNILPKLFKIQKSA